MWARQILRWILTAYAAFPQFHSNTYAGHAGWQPEPALQQQARKCSPQRSLPTEPPLRAAAPTTTSVCHEHGWAMSTCPRDLTRKGAFVQLLIAQFTARAPPPRGLWLAAQQTAQAGQRSSAAYGAAAYGAACKAPMVGHWLAAQRTASATSVPSQWRQLAADRD